MAEVAGGGGTAPAPEVTAADGFGSDAHARAHSPQALAASARAVAGEEAAAYGRARDKLARDIERADAIVASSKASVEAHRKQAKVAAEQAERLEELAREGGQQ